MILMIMEQLQAMRSEITVMMVRLLQLLIQKQLKLSFAMSLLKKTLQIVQVEEQLKCSHILQEQRFL